MKKNRKNNNYTYEFKKEMCEKYLSGEYGGGMTFCQKFGIKSKRQLYDWVKLYRKDPELLKVDNRGKGTKADGVNKGKRPQLDLTGLSKDEKIERLEMEVDILKKSEGSPQALRRALKYMIVYDLKDKYKIKKLCKYLRVSTSGYYNWIKLGKPIRYSFDEKLADMIEEIFYETYKGYRFIRDEIIRRYGVIFNDKTIYKYMKILELSSPIRKKRFESCTTQDSNEKARNVSNNVLARNFTASRPYEKLVTDISYIYHEKGRLFLSVIKDLYDKSIAAYKVSKFNDLSLVMDTISQLINDNWNQTIFCLLHSDQGFQYTNRLYVEYLERHGVTVSHSRKANCYDNACCENFFSQIKSDYLELNGIPKDESSLIKTVDKTIYWYNNERPQRKLKGMTPIKYRESYLSRVLF